MNDEEKSKECPVIQMGFADIRQSSHAKADERNEAECPQYQEGCNEEVCFPYEELRLEAGKRKEEGCRCSYHEHLWQVCFSADASDRIEVCLPDAVAEAALLGFFFCLDGFVVRKGFHFRAVHEGCREGGISFGRDGDENGSDCISKDVHVVGMFCAAFCFFQFLYEIIAVLCRHFNVNGSDLLLSDADAGDGYVHPVEGCFFFSF